MQQETILTTFDALAERAPPGAPATSDLSRKDLTTLHALFRHPTAHNLHWRDALALAKAIGQVEDKSDSHVVLHIGGESLTIHRPHSKDLTGEDVIDLRHLMTRAGYTAEAVPPAPDTQASTAPDLLVAIAHHEARIFHLDLPRGTEPGTIRPYDPHHFLHHMRHKDEDHERGQKSPEDATFYARIAAAVGLAGRIVIIGHGTGASNAAEHLAEYLRTHHPETFARVVTDMVADVSALTDHQLMALAAAALHKAGAPAP
jgi:hypothetical protein